MFKLCFTGVVVLTSLFLSAGSMPFVAAARDKYSTEGVRKPVGDWECECPALTSDDESTCNQSPAIVNVIYPGDFEEENGLCWKPDTDCFPPANKCEWKSALGTPIGVTATGAGWYIACDTFVDSNGDETEICSDVLLGNSSTVQLPIALFCGTSVYRTVYFYAPNLAPLTCGTPPVQAIGVLRFTCEDCDAGE
jgi:hypothetical protein